MLPHEPKVTGRCQAAQTDRTAPPLIAEDPDYGDAEATEKCKRRAETRDPGAQGFVRDLPPQRGAAFQPEQRNQQHDERDLDRKKHPVAPAASPEREPADQHQHGADR